MTEAVQTDVETYTKQHAKVMRFEISVGADDDEHTIEFFEEGVRRALANAADDDRNEFTFHNLTVMGGYYIIDGKVCLPQDYDPATKNRKPGTFPPMWAGGPDPKKQQLPASSTEETEDNDEQPREFVRVKPTIRQRDPVTGRRVRKDKGVKRGPRKVSDEAKAAIAKMTEQFKETQQ